MAKAKHKKNRGEMEKLGFLVVDGEVRAFLDDDNKAVTPKRAKREGYDGA